MLIDTNQVAMVMIEVERYCIFCEVGDEADGTVYIFKNTVRYSTASWHYSSRRNPKICKPTPSP
jgi:hypothetical protein